MGSSFKALVAPIAEMDVKPELMMELTPSVESGIGCTICELIIGYAEDKLESNATIAKIEEFLNTTVCGFLPKFLRPECQALVDEYAPEIAQKIEQKETASHICSEIHLCKNSTKVEVKPELMVPLVKSSPLKALVAPIAEMDVKPELMMKL